MLKIKRLARIVAFIALNLPLPAFAAGFNQYFGFGDSTLDSGYFRYTTTGTAPLDSLIATQVAGGANGGFAGNGTMDSTILAGKFGLTADPASAPGGGTNYANGGSYTAVNALPTSGNVSLVQQIQNYLASTNGVANPNAIYVTSSGNNDLIFVTNQGSVWRDAHPDYLSQQASAFAAAVASLQSAGARNILVPNFFAYAVLADYGGGISGANVDTYGRSTSYSADIWGDLSAAHVRYVPADLDSVFKFVVKNPVLFGFTSSSVLAANAPVYSAPSPYNTALLAILTPEQQRDYLFIDGKHLTTAGQTIEADYEYSLLAAPSQISLLAESVIQGGWNRAATIQGQIEASQKQRGPHGVNLWTAAGAYSSRNTNAPGFPNDSGAPYGGSVGIDFQTTEGVILGAAFSTGSQRQEFSTGGFFDQTDEAPSLYAAYAGETYWSDAVLTYDFFQDQVSRPVPLGIYTDQNHADASGESLSLALRGGTNMNLSDRIITGPVVGLHLQQAYVNGFTETGASGVTALSFAGQTRNSLVSQIGWRALLDLGGFQPFAEMSWNHELASRNRSITTTLTSSGIAPSYTMDAAPVAADWAVATLGAYYKLSPQAMLRGSTSTMFCNPRTITTGGELGLNVAF